MEDARLLEPQSHFACCGAARRFRASGVSKVRSDADALGMMDGYQGAIIHHGQLAPGASLFEKPFRKSDLARMPRAAIAA